LTNNLNDNCIKQHKRGKVHLIYLRYMGDKPMSEKFSGLQGTLPFFAS